jgi:hypothetical protein
MFTLPVALALLAVPAAAPTPTATADVWEVGGAGLATIGDAVALAADGDVVLVHPGTYPGFWIGGKSITVVASAGAAVKVAGTVAVYALAGDQAVTLQGLQIWGGFGDAGVRATANDGALWIEDCTIHGSASLEDAAPAMQVVSCASVAVRRSTLVGGSLGFFFDSSDYVAGGPGASVRESTAAFFACTLAGGQGADVLDLNFWGDCDEEPGGPGGDGLHVESSTVLLQDVAVKGGRGGTGAGCVGPGPGCGPGGSGGDGLVAVGSGQITLIGSTLAGGPGGSAGGDPLHCPHGADGQAEVLEGSQPPLVLSTTPVALEAGSPLREGELAAVAASGEPGALLAVLASGGAPASGELPGAVGQLLITPPAILLGAAVLPPGGTVLFQTTVSEIGAGVDAFPLRLQTLALTGAGELVLGEAATLVLLDAAF